MTEIDFLSSVSNRRPVAPSHSVGAVCTTAISATFFWAGVSTVGRGAVGLGRMNAPRNVFPRRSGDLDG